MKKYDKLLEMLTGQRAEPTSKFQKLCQLLEIGENSLQQTILDCDGITVLVLHEARYRGKPIGGNYSAQIHKAHDQVTGEDHITVYKGQNKIFSMNFGGTGHDGYHGYRIPNKVQKGIEKNFNDVNIPDDGIIEAAPQALLDELKLILEASPEIKGSLQKLSESLSLKSSLGLLLE